MGTTPSTTPTLSLWLSRPILYSINTRLAYRIAEQFFRQVHYAWVCPFFGEDTVPPFFSVPPTSLPERIYSGFAEEVRGGDLHSSRIDQNRIGLRRGATAKLKAGVINDAQFKEINEVLRRAQIADFEPLIYVIPTHVAAPLVSEVPVKERANPLSPEFRIFNLPRAAFDIMRVNGC